MPDSSGDDPARPPTDAATPAGGRESLLKRLGPTAILAFGAASLPAIGGILLFMYIASIGGWLRSHQTEGVMLYSVAFMVLAGLAFLPTYAQSVLGGWAFGVAVGFPAALAGFVGGGLLGYIIASTVTGDRVEKIIDEKPKWRAVREALIGREAGFWRTLGLVILLRMPPNSPFALTNLLMASTKVPRLPFVLGTAIGMTPRTLLAVFIGHSLEQLTQDSIKDAGRAYLPWLMGSGIAIAIIVLVIIQKVSTRAISKLAGSAENGRQGADEPTARGGRPTP